AGLLLKCRSFPRSIWSGLLVIPIRCWRWSGWRKRDRKKPPGCGGFAQSSSLLNLRIQLASRITLEHLLEVNWLDLAGLAGTTEGFVASYADVGHGNHGGLEEFARVEFGRVLGHEATNRTG